MDYKKIAPNGLECGTVLELTALNSFWDFDKLVKLKRHLQRLINPAQVCETQDFIISLEAKEYTLEDSKREEYEKINGQVQNVVFEALNIQTTYVNVSIDNKGEKITTELFDKDRFIFRLIEKNIFPTLRDLKVKVFYLNSQAKRTFTKMMGIQPVRYGSIFLYKNGFKINPYGDEGDDWLGLDRRKSQGTRRYLSNREIMGRVELNGYQPSFIEVSSRDGGVTKNEDFKVLTEDFFINKVLRRLERYVVEGLEWDSATSLKGLKDPEAIKKDSLKIIDQIVGQVKDEEKKLTFNKDLLEIYAEKQIEAAPEIIKNVEHLSNFVKTDEEKDVIKRQAKVLNNAFMAFQAKQLELQERLHEKEKMVSFLERATSDETKEIMGLQHHVGNATSIIKVYLKRLREQTLTGKDIPSQIVAEIIDKISLQVLTISSIAVYATHASFDIRTEKTKRDIVSFIQQYIENAYIIFNKARLDYEKVSINVKNPNLVEFDYEFNPIDFIIVIDNLISNARKARANQIIIEFDKKSENELDIKFSDNGTGIPQKNFESLFTFGFSTTGGTGIGLYQVKKILSKYGSISVTSVPKKTEFLIKVVR